MFIKCLPYLAQRPCISIHDTALCINASTCEAHFDGLSMDSGLLVDFGVVLDIDGKTGDSIGQTIRFSSSSKFSSLLNYEP